MIKFVIWAIIILSRLLLAQGEAQSVPTPDNATTVAEVADVEGAGWKFLTCVGCVAGATVIVLGGPATIVAAIWAPGSAIAAAACIHACATM